MAFLQMARERPLACGGECAFGIFTANEGSIVVAECGGGMAESVSGKRKVRYGGVLDCGNVGVKMSFL